MSLFSKKPTYKIVCNKDGNEIVWKNNVSISDAEEIIRGFYETQTTFNRILEKFGTIGIIRSGTENNPSVDGTNLVLPRCLNGIPFAYLSINYMKNVDLEIVPNK